MPKDPTAALLIIGAEVLSGKVDDANGPYLLRALRLRGVALQEIRTIGDDVNAIADAVRALSSQVDDVYSTGGIGPTHDDVTIAGMARAFGRSVVHHPDLMHLLTSRYKGSMNEARLKMAEVPEGAQLILGNGQMVPVVKIENVTILPGVPSLMRACFSQLPHAPQGAAFVSRALLLDVSESAIAAALTQVQKSYPELDIGSYPRFDAAPYRVKVTVDGRSTDAVSAAIAAIREHLLPAWIVGEE